jgi:hypothetical protein
MRLKIFVLAAVAIAVFACGDQMVRRRVNKPIAQKVVFLHSFVNYAWGYQNRGFFIDSEGYMKAYRVKSAADWKQPESTGPDSGYISTEDLLSNYGLADKVIYKVPPVELSNNFDLIKVASEEEITERVRGAYDAGLVQNTAYFWNPDKRKFKVMLLRVSGDFEQKNHNPAAEQIDVWIDNLNKYYADSLAVWQK